MKKRIFLALGALVLVAVTNQISALNHESYIDYYDDDAFLDWRGYYYYYCDDVTIDTNNVVKPWRIWSMYYCSNSERFWHKCQQSDGMGGWIDIGCPAWDQ